MFTNLQSVSISSNKTVKIRGKGLNRLPLSLIFCYSNGLFCYLNLSVKTSNYMNNNYINCGVLV